MSLRFSEAMELLEDGKRTALEEYYFLMQCCSEYRRQILHLFVDECMRDGGNIADTIAYVRQFYGKSLAVEAEWYYRELLKEKGGDDAGN